MQAENIKNNIKVLSFGCRLNALESEKIKKMLSPVVNSAILVNTCAVTAEAERQSGQAVRRIARDNPNVPIFVTGCAATRNAGLFADIPNTIVVDNRDKMRLGAYMESVASTSCHQIVPEITMFHDTGDKLSKQFVQIQNGCNHECAYCVTRLLRGPAVSFEYADILSDVRDAVSNGFYEIVLTGVDIASYAKNVDGNVMLISDLCRALLRDVPEIRRMRLSSMDPASPEIDKIIDLIHADARMMPHMHLSMQSCSDTILRAMRRRHNAQRIRDIVRRAPDITFSWDIICGFPGETDELFAQTLDMVHETRPIKIHAFPFSPRPGTVAADMPCQVARTISKQRVKIITDTAEKHMLEYMAGQIGQTVQVLVEDNNTARTPDDIPVQIAGTNIPARTICNVKITGMNATSFTAERAQTTD